jgi:hypothetical protein
MFLCVVKDSYDFACVSEEMYSQALLYNVMRTIRMVAQERLNINLPHRLLLSLTIAI